MRDTREHAQFDVIDVSGKLTHSIKVEIINIHLGGVALIAENKLDVGGEYVIKLGDKGRSIDVKGVVIRSTLVGMEPGTDGKNVLLYAVGMKFREGSEDRITAFLNSVEHHVKEETAHVAERRQAVRHHIITRH